MKRHALAAIAVAVTILSGTGGARSQDRGEAGEPRVPAKTVSVPRQAHRFTWVYRPAGDAFYGPDTKHLQEGQWYDQWVPNDHAFVKGPQGRWHIIGITHPRVESDPLSEGIHEGEFASFHAVSSATDFRDTLETHHYADLPKVLPPRERPGEPLENHAPSILEKDGLYYGYLSSAEWPHRGVSVDRLRWEAGPR